MSKKVTLSKFITYCSLAGLIVDSEYTESPLGEMIIVKRGIYKGIVHHKDNVVTFTTLMKKDKFGTEVFQQPGLQTIYSKMVKG